MFSNKKIITNLLYFFLIPSISYAISYITDTDKNHKYKLYHMNNCEYLGDSWINYRCPVLEGWIIVTIYGVSISSTFMPDKKHQWEIK